MDGTTRSIQIHFKPHLLPGVHGGPVELPDTEAAKLEIRGERLGWVENIGVPPVGHVGAFFERLLFPLDPRAETLERRGLASLVDLLLLPLGIPLDAQHLRRGGRGEEGDVVRDKVL